MQLRHLYIERFMNLERFSLSFRNEPGEKSLYDNVNVRFFIGPNGSGKSHVMEALGLIFSSLINEIRPDLEFALEYELRGKLIRIIGTSALPPQLQEAWFQAEKPKISRQHGVGVYIKESGSQHWIFQDPPKRDSYTPACVLGMYSGPTSGLRWAMFDRPLAYFAEEVQEEYGQSDADLESEHRYAMQMDTLSRWDRMLDNPQVLVMGPEDSRLAMVALLLYASANTPGVIQRLIAQAHVIPIEGLGAFSLDIRGDWHEVLTDTLRSRLEDLLRLATVRVFQPSQDGGRVGGNDSVSQDFVAVFDVTPDLVDTLRTTLHLESLGFFLSLVAWKRRGVVKDVHLAISSPKEDGLMPEGALSDGEFLRLGRYAVLTMLRDQPDCLLLLDEPETHFNDTWKVSLVSDVIDIFRNPSASCTHEICVATHSSITLSDADSRQVYAFEEGQVRPVGRTFGADLGEITFAIAGAPFPRGIYVRDLVLQAIDKKDRELLTRLSRTLAPGYLHMRVVEVLDTLRE